MGPGIDRKRYCSMCYLSIINMQASAGADSDSDDDMAFSNPATSDSGSRQNSFQKTAVKRDALTGEITGWQDFYAMARLDNPSLQAEEAKHTAMFTQAQENLTRNTAPTYLVLKQQNRHDERIVMIKNSASGEEIAVQVIQGAGMTVQLKNLQIDLE